MSLPLKAKVKDGRIVLDEPTELPEGMVIDLFPSTSFDQLTKEEQEEIDTACDEAEAELNAGKGISAKDFAEQLRSR